MIERKTTSRLLTMIMAVVMVLGLYAATSQRTHAASGYEGTTVSELTDGDYIIVGEAGSTWNTEGRAWFAMRAESAGDSGSGYGIIGERLDGFNKANVTTTNEDTVWTYDSSTGSFKNRATSKYLNIPSSSFSGEFFSDTPVTLSFYSIGNNEATIYVPSGNGGYYLGTGSSVSKPFDSNYGRYINSSYLKSGSGVYFCKLAETDPLQTAKETAAEDLNAHRASKVDASYRSEQVTELNNALTNGLAAIEAAASEDDVQTALSEAKAALDAVKTSDQLNEEEKQDLIDRLAKAEGDLADKEKELEQTKTDLDKANKDLTDTKTELEQTKTDLDKTNKDLADTKAELDKASKDLADTEAELDNTKSELEQTKADLARAKEDLEKERAANQNGGSTSNNGSAARTAAYVKVRDAAMSRSVSGFNVAAQKGKKAQATWEKATGINGYVLYRAAGTNGKYSVVRTITSPSTVKHIQTGLKANQTYFYRLRPYSVLKTPTGKLVRIYGKWSPVKVVRGME